MPTSEQLKKQLLELGILTLVTVIIWTIYGVYNAITEPSQSSVSKEELQAVPTKLDLELLGRLKNRLIIDEDSVSRHIESRYSGNIEESPTTPNSTDVLENLVNEATESASASASSTF